jgi:hypothetical protein
MNGKHRHERMLDDEELQAMHAWRRQVRLNAAAVCEAAYSVRVQSRAIVARCVEDRLERANAAAPTPGLP